MTSTFLPPSRPDISAIDAIELAGQYYDPALKVWLLGRRGYYRDTMGKIGENDRNIYDDAIALVTPDKVFTWNANCDPSKSGGEIARLACGLWWYKLGMHHIGQPTAYRALIQYAQVMVIRDNRHAEMGYFGINIHRGGHATSTGSAGCQTIYDEQYDEFLKIVEQTMVQFKMDKIAYILTERT